MPKKEKRIDTYIAKSAEFAKPILNHFRSLVHKTCPELEEKVKWGFPHFDYKGGPMCSMAAFKKHCAIGFWKAELMKNGKTLVKNAQSEAAMGHFGKVSSLKDLPSDKTIVSYIKEAMRLNEEGIKLSPKKTSAKEKQELKLPNDFLELLSKTKGALKQFEAFTPGRKKDYLSWIRGAKTEITRNKRMNTAIDWISEGKDLNWRYSKQNS